VPYYCRADPALPGVFQALADPTRLAVVERLSIAPASSSELAKPFAMALPSFMQHMGVLERAGIVSSHKSGRTRTYQLAPGALQLASAWLSEFRNHWERRLDQLDHLLVTDGYRTAGPGIPSPTPPIAHKERT
jgi:DNA-binding transcriptional ArsR family regulator